MQMVVVVELLLLSRDVQRMQMVVVVELLLLSRDVQRMQMVVVVEWVPCCQGMCQGFRCWFPLTPGHVRMRPFMHMYIR